VAGVEEAVFVLSAAGFSSGGGTATLHGLSPATLYVADRPGREVGHLTSRRFVERWAERFAGDPPSAVVSFVDRDGGDAVVVLSSPILTGDVLTYKVAVLEGLLPAESGPCAVFIDAAGRASS